MIYNGDIDKEEERKMQDLEKYYAIKVKKTSSSEFEYLGSIYNDSINKYESIDDAMKYPFFSTAQVIAEYIKWRKDILDYKIIKIETTYEEVEEEG